MDLCLRVLKEKNKSRFDSYSVRNSVLFISHITFRDCRVHIFFDNLSRNSSINLTIMVENSTCTGHKKVLSGSSGQAEFLAGKVTFTYMYPHKFAKWGRVKTRCSLTKSLM